MSHCKLTEKEHSNKCQAGRNGRRGGPSALQWQKNKLILHGMSEENK